MVEKAFAVEPYRKAFVLIRHRSNTIAICVGAFLLFIGETIGTAQELPTGTIDPSDRVSMERSGLGGIGDPAAAMQNRQPTASPGQWLIDDVARERAKFELRRVSPKPLSATNARDAAHVCVGLPCTDERRAGKPMVEDRTLATHSPPQALKRSNGGPDPSLGLVDSATKCVEAPVGLASEGGHWFYRLDRETHRKCWYVRAFREDRAVASSKAINVRLSLLRQIPRFGSGLVALGMIDRL